MLLRAIIHFNRQSLEDGFGFTCMKKAYSMKITGRMDYSPDTGAKILAEGEEDNLHAFIGWIRENIKDPGKLDYDLSTHYLGLYTEFDIFRHTAREYM